MRKWIIAAIVIAALAGCASKGTQEAAPVEDKGAGTTATTPGDHDDRRRRDGRRRHRDRRSRRTRIRPTSCRRSAASTSTSTST